MQVRLLQAALPNFLQFIDFRKRPELLALRKFALLSPKGQFWVSRVGLLNKRNVPSPWGKKSSQRQVESVVENEAYTGSTINGETYRGIYNRQKKGKGFEPLNRMRWKSSPARPCQ